jgi:hypothetical protein
MFGHACFPVDPVGGAPVFCEGAGVVGVDVDGAADCVVPAALVVLPVAAAAPLMPAAAPPVTSAPATIVAPSILDIFMVRTSWVDWLLVQAIVGPPAKRIRSCA